MDQEIINAITEGLIGGAAIGAIATIIIILFATMLLGLYIYFALAWTAIARKLKYKKAWLAWIPFANVGMILQLGGFHWALAFLFLVPILGWIALFILSIIATWNIFEKRRYPGWLSLTQFAPAIYLVVIGFVAWYEQKNRRKK
jgi:hypothetical protein